MHFILLFRDRISSKIEPTVLDGQSEIKPRDGVSDHGEIHDIFEETFLDYCDWPYVDDSQEDEREQSEMKKSLVAHCWSMNVCLDSSLIVKKVSLGSFCVDFEDGALVGHFA